MTNLAEELRAYIDREAPPIALEDLPSPSEEGGADAGDQPRARGGDRARARRVVLVAAAILVVALIAGSVLSLGRGDRTSVVETGGNAVAETSVPPFLGFRDQPLRVGGIRPGIGYRVFDVPDRDGALQAELIVYREGGCDVWWCGGGRATGQIGVVTTDGRDVSVEDVVRAYRDLVLGNTLLVARWSPARGYVAELSAEYIDGRRAEAEERLRSAAARVSRFSRAEFEAALGDRGPHGENVTPLVPGKSFRTVLVESYPEDHVTLAVTAGAQQVEVTIRHGAYAADFDAYYADHGRPVSVRDTTAYVFDIRDDAAGTTIGNLAWVENDNLVSVTAPRPVDDADLVEVAESLRRPSEDEWSALLFP